jgi:hypothetical protein
MIFLYQQSQDMTCGISLLLHFFYLFLWSQSFSSKCFCRHSLLRRPMPSHCLQMGHSVKLYLVLGKCGPMGALMLYTQAAVIRLPLHHTGVSTSASWVLSSHCVVSTTIFVICMLSHIPRISLLRSAHRLPVPGLTDTRVPSICWLLF